MYLSILTLHSSLLSPFHSPCPGLQNSNQYPLYLPNHSPFCFLVGFVLLFCDPVSFLTVAYRCMSWGLFTGAQQVTSGYNTGGNVPSFPSKH